MCHYLLKNGCSVQVGSWFQGTADHFCAHGTCSLPAGQVTSQTQCNKINFCLYSKRDGFNLASSCIHLFLHPPSSALKQVTLVFKYWVSIHSKNYGLGPTACTNQDFNKAELSAQSGAWGWKSQPRHPVHTHLCLSRWLCSTPEGHALGIPPEPLLEHTLDLGHQLSSALPWGPCSWERGGKHLTEYKINQLKMNY